MTLEEAVNYRFKFLLDSLRARGWRVAVHNDYKLAGQDMTFWLFTHAAYGRFIKGEGKTDAMAVYIAGLELDDFVIVSPERCPKCRGKWVTVVVHDQVFGVPVHAVVAKAKAKDKE